MKHFVFGSEDSGHTRHHKCMTSFRTFPSYENVNYVSVFDNIITFNNASDVTDW